MCLLLGMFVILGRTLLRCIRLFLWGVPLGLSILHVFVKSLIVLLKELEFRVVKARLDVEGQGQVFKDILTNGLVIILHVNVQSLFIVYVEVVFNLVVKFVVGVLDGQGLCVFDFGKVRFHITVLQTRYLLFPPLHCLRSSSYLAELVVLVARSPVRELALHVLEDLLDLVLCPDEVEVPQVSFIGVVTLDPPVPVLEESLDHHGVVAFANDVLVNDIRMGKLELVSRLLCCLILRHRRTLDRTLNLRSGISYYIVLSFDLEAHRLRFRGVAASDS